MGDAPAERGAGDAADGAGDAATGRDRQRGEDARHERIRAPEASPPALPEDGVGAPHFP